MQTGELPWKLEPLLPTHKKGRPSTGDEWQFSPICAAVFLSNCFLQLFCNVSAPTASPKWHKKLMENSLLIAVFHQP